mmetsp:Transcript_3136/g.6345  ORF Transcript_3136/g.6345 Transcript_3136/m.6345 type:complete len:598 (-) Transcript_3136:456-2249(-)
MTGLQQGGDALFILVVQIGALLNQYLGEFFIFNQDRVKQEIVFHTFFVGKDGIGISASLDQGQGYLAVVTLDGKRQGCALVVIGNGRFGTIFQKEINGIQMTALGCHMQGRDTVNVVFGIRDGSFFNHFGETFRIVRCRLGDGVNVGSKTNQFLDTFRMTASRGKHDGRTTGVGQTIEVTIKGTLLFESFHNNLETFKTASRRDTHQGRNTIVVDAIKVGTMLHQELECFDSTRRGGFEQGRAAIVVLGINVDTALIEQKFDHVHVFVGRRVHERGDTTVVGQFLDGGSGLHEIFDGFQISVRRRHNESIESSRGLEVQMILVIHLVHQELETSDGTLFGRIHNGRQTILIGSLGIGSVFEQQLNGIGMSTHGCRHEGRDTIRSGIGGIGALFEQHLHDIDATFSGGQPQGGNVRFGRLIIRGTRFNQVFHHLDVPHNGGFHEGGNTIFIGRVNIDAFTDQILANIQMSRRSGRHESGQIIPIADIDIDPFVFEQSLDGILVTVTGRTDQSCPRRRHGFNVGRRRKLQLQGRKGDIGGFAGGRFDGIILSDQARLAIVGRQHVSGIIVAQNVPRFGSTVTALVDFDILQFEGIPLFA